MNEDALTTHCTFGSVSLSASLLSFLFPLLLICSFLCIPFSTSCLALSPALLPSLCCFVLLLMTIHVHNYLYNNNNNTDQQQRWMLVIINYWLIKEARGVHTMILTDFVWKIKQKDWQTDAEFLPTLGSNLDLMPDCKIHLTL